MSHQNRHTCCGHSWWNRCICTQKTPWRHNVRYQHTAMIRRDRGLYSGNCVQWRHSAGTVRKAMTHMGQRLSTGKCRLWRHSARAVRMAMTRMGQRLSTDKCRLWRHSAAAEHTATSGRDWQFLWRQSGCLRRALQQRIQLCNLLLYFDNAQTSVSLR